MSPVFGHANTHGRSSVFLCVFCVCACPGTISTATSRLSGEQGTAGGGGHRHTHVQPGLTLAMNPAGGQRRGREERGRKKRRRERERKEEMEGDLWAVLAKGLPFHKPIGLDYKTMLLFKRALFFHSCVVGSTVGG